MFDIPKLYASACSNSVQLVPLQPIIISILFHHYKELKECTKEVEEMMMEGNVYNSIMKMEMEKLHQTEEEMKEEEIIPTTLHSFL